jgi:hypothetical protein
MSARRGGGTRRPHGLSITRTAAAARNRQRRLTHIARQGRV